MRWWGGNYIGMMPGNGKPQTHFIALDTQPKFHQNTGELMIHLQANDLGSLNIGSLVYYRKIPVGKVYDYRLAAESGLQKNSGQAHRGVIIDVLIDRRFITLVKDGRPVYQAAISPLINRQQHFLGRKQ